MPLSARESILSEDSHDIAAIYLIIFDSSFFFQRRPPMRLPTGEVENYEQYNVNQHFRKTAV